MSSFLHIFSSSVVLNEFKTFQSHIHAHTHTQILSLTFITVISPPKAVTIPTIVIESRSGSSIYCFPHPIIPCVLLLWYWMVCSLMVENHWCVNENVWEKLNSKPFYKVALMPQSVYVCVWVEEIEVEVERETVRWKTITWKYLSMDF